MSASWFVGGCLLAVTPHGEGSEKFCRVSFMKAFISFLGLPPPNLTTSQSPHLLMPACWDLGFQHMNICHSDHSTFCILSVEHPSETESNQGGTCLACLLLRPLGEIIFLLLKDFISNFPSVGVNNKNCSFIPKTVVSSTISRWSTRWTALGSQ